MRDIQNLIATDTRYRVFFLSAVLAAVSGAAAENYFIQDDGFISLRYAYNWAQGFGPVWYPGSQEFGYTNFLFVALCAGLISVGFGPELAGGIVSFFGFAIAVLSSYAIVLRLTRNTMMAGAAVLVIFTNFTVSSYASGLLETSLQTGLVLFTYWAVVLFSQEHKTWQCIVIALAASLALLVRLDSSILLIPAGVYTLSQIRTPRQFIICGIVPAVIVASFLLFCYLQYGSVLPNTFYAKADNSAWRIGVGYVKLFLDADNFQFVVFFTALLAIILFDGRWRTATQNWPAVALIMAPAVLWTAYVVYIGGGFMGFRFMVPVVAFFFIAFFILAAQFGKVRLIICLAAYALMTTFTHHYIAETRQASYKSGVEPPQELNRHVAASDISWTIVGKRLNELFYTGAKSDVSIALTPAGSIPFFSKLPTIDMLGLNDRWIARYGDNFSKRAGHRKIAPPAYLVSRGVNLIIGHPGYVCNGNINDPHQSTRVPYEQPKMVLIRINRDCDLIAVYNKEHAMIEALLRDDAEPKLISYVSLP